MYSASEKTKIKQAFWTAFGRYLSLELNSEGEKINWINYHTGFKDLYFRMDADQNNAYIGIEITHSDELLRHLYFEKFHSFKKILKGSMDESWQWQISTNDEYGNPLSKIYMQLENVNVFNIMDWPRIISFLKPRIVGLDKFWNLVKDGFEELR